MSEHLCCRSHCCKQHGCKYGHDDCPVTTGAVVQDHPCEYCHRPDCDCDECEVPRLRATLAELRAEVEKLRTVLRNVEWKGGDAVAYCPACGRPQHIGHFIGCALAAALDRGWAGG